MIRTGMVLTALAASAALAGCGGASKTSAACPPLTVGEDGSVSPLTCGGSNNPAAVSYYKGNNPRGFDPKVITLSSQATKAQVIATICSDISAPGSKMGLQTETDAYDLAAKAAGWSYDIKVVGLSC